MIVSGSTLNRDFNEKTCLYVINDISSGTSFGSMFNLKQSLDFELCNLQNREFLNLYDHGDLEYYLPQICSYHAYHEKTRNHAIWTGVFRMNCGFSAWNVNPKAVVKACWSPTDFPYKFHYITVACMITEK